MCMKLIVFLLCVVATHGQKLQWNYVADNRRLECCYTTEDIGLHPALWETFRFPEWLTIQTIHRDYRIEFAISTQDEVECGTNTDQYPNESYSFRCFYATIHKRCGYLFVDAMLNVQDRMWICYVNSSYVNDSSISVIKILPVLPSSSSPFRLLTVTTTAAGSTTATARSGTKSVEYFPLFVICVFSQLVILARDW